MSIFSKNVIFLLCVISLSPCYVFSEEERPDHDISLICRKLTERIKEIEEILPDLEEQEQEACLQEKEALANALANLKEAEEKAKEIEKRAWFTASIGGVILLLCAIVGTTFVYSAFGYRKKIRRSWNENLTKIRQHIHRREIDEIEKIIDQLGEPWETISLD